MPICAIKLALVEKKITIEKTISGGDSIFSTTFVGIT